MTEFSVALYLSGKSARADYPDAHADIFILDLEDSVAPDIKAEARVNVINLLARPKPEGSQVAVRINIDEPEFTKDIDLLRENGGWDSIVLPKASAPLDLNRLADLVDLLSADEKGRLWLMGEQAGFELLVDQLVCLHPFVQGVLIGYKDLSLSMGVAMDPASPILRTAAGGIRDIAHAKGWKVFDGPTIGSLELCQSLALTARSEAFDGICVLYPALSSALKMPNQH